MFPDILSDEDFKNSIINLQKMFFDLAHSINEFL